MEMEVYKMRKVIENQMIEIQIVLQKLEATKEELRKTLKRRKEIAIKKIDTQHK